MTGSSDWPTVLPHGSGATRPGEPGTMLVLSGPSGLSRSQEKVASSIPGHHQAKPKNTSRGAGYLRDELRSEEDEKLLKWHRGEGLGHIRRKKYQDPFLTAGPPAAHRHQYPPSTIQHAAAAATTTILIARGKRA